MSTNWQMAGVWGPWDYTDTAGNVLQGSLTVYSDAARTVPASLYTDETKATAASNPVTQDSLGNFTFFADPGVYYGTFTHAGVDTPTTHLVSPYPTDPALGSAVQMTAADTTVVVTNPTVGTYSVKANTGTTAGTVAAGNDARIGTINGVAVSGTPSSGYVPRASGASTAAWAQLSYTDVGAEQAGVSLLIANNLSDLANAGTARTNLGLGTAATANVGTTTGTVAAGDDARFGQIAGVAVSGVAAANQVPIASSSSAAAWGQLSAGQITGLGGAATLNVGTTSGTVAAGNDARFGTVGGIAVTGTPAAGMVPRASSGTAAAWATLASTDISGLGTAATANIGTGAGTVAAGDDARFGKIIGPTTVTASGTPAAGDVLVASNSTAAAWQAPNVISGVTVSATAPTAGQVLTAQTATTADWQTITATTLQGVAVSATAPTAGQVLTAQTATTADWQTVTATTVNGTTVSGTPASAGLALISTGASAAGWSTPTVSAISGVSVPASPTAGQVLTATSGTAATWQNVTANTLQGVAISATAPTANQVLTATGGSNAHWADPPGIGFTIATGVVGDNGLTDNTSYLQGLINTVAANGGGAIWVPYTTGDIGITYLNVPDHVHIWGLGKQMGKAVGSAPKAGGTCFCVYTGTTYAGGTSIQSLIELGNNSGLHNLYVKGYCSNTGGYKAPVTVWVHGGGCDLIDIGIDSGQGPGLLLDGNSIDTNIHNVYLTSNNSGGTRYYITSCSSASTAKGDTTFTVADATHVKIGQNPKIMGQHVGDIPPDAIVTNVVGSTVTISDHSGTNGATEGLQGNIANFSVVFIDAPTCVTGNSDIMFVGVRSITGSFVNNGADSQFIGCHFSTAGQNHTHNFIQNASQGSTFSGCTFDTMHGADEGLFLRIYGPANFGVCRIQCGANSTNGETQGVCFVQDLGSDTTHGIEMVGCEVPTIGDHPITGLICYSKYLYDSGTSAYVAVAQATGTPSGYDMLGPNNIDHDAIMTTPDALSASRPNLATQVTSADSTATATYIPFPGYAMPQKWGQPSAGGIKYTWSSLPVAAQHWTPAAATGLTGTTAAPVFAGFGTTCVFVPHSQGLYEVELQLSSNTASGNSYFSLRYGTGTAPAANSAVSATTNTTFSDANYENGPDIGTVTLRGFINVDATLVGQKIWVDVAQWNSAGTSTSLTPNCMSLKGPYVSYN